MVLSRLSNIITPPRNSSVYGGVRPACVIFSCLSWCKSSTDVSHRPYCYDIPIGVANGTSENVGLGKFWQDLEISEAFLISLEVSFLHGLYLLFLSLETFYQRVSGSDF